MNDIAARRQEEKDRRREDILDAAAAVADVVSIESMTMDQVARKARLSRALLYVYFHDKQDLVLGLADRAHHLLAKRLKAIRARRRPGLEQIRAMGKAYVNFAEQDPVYFAALACFAAHAPDNEAPDANLQRCIQSGDAVHGLMIQALEAGIKDGSISADIGNPYLVAVTLWGFMHGIIQLIATKAELFSLKGITQKQLVDSALLLATRSLEQSV